MPTLRLCKRSASWGAGQGAESGRASGAADRSTLPLLLTGAHDVKVRWAAVAGPRAPGISKHLGRRESVALLRDGAEAFAGVLATVSSGTLDELDPVAGKATGLFQAPRRAVRGGVNYWAGLKAGH